MLEVAQIELQLLTLEEHEVVKGEASNLTRVQWIGGKLKNVVRPAHNVVELPKVAAIVHYGVESAIGVVVDFARKLMLVAFQLQSTSILEALSSTVPKRTLPRILEGLELLQLIVLAIGFTMLLIVVHSRHKQTQCQGFQKINGYNLT